MSRIGARIINIPESVTVKLENGWIVVSGPKGELRQRLFDGFAVEIDGGSAKVIKKVQNMQTQRQFGLLRTLIDNMVVGVSTGFTKKLQINGVGYRVASEGAGITLSLGYSHKISYTPPEGINLAIEANTITVSGHDKQLVGEVAAKIRSYRPPEPYKGKGIKYEDERIRRKAGKAAVKG